MNKLQKEYLYETHKTPIVYDEEGYAIPHIGYVRWLENRQSEWSNHASDISVLRGALEIIQAFCGDVDPQRGMRNILHVCKNALGDVKR